MDGMGRAAGLVGVALLLGVGAAAAPPTTIAWPAELNVDKVALEVVQDTDRVICMRGTRNDVRLFYVSVKTPSGGNAEKAAFHAEAQAKFQVVEANAKEATIKRGGPVSWVSFSIRAVPTRTIIRTGTPRSEIFYRLKFPLTSIPTKGDWQKLCREGRDILEAGANG